MTSELSAPTRPPFSLLVAGAMSAVVSALCLLGGGEAANLAGYAFGIIGCLTFASVFDRIDNTRRGSVWYSYFRWAGPANLGLRLLGLIFGILNLWAFVTALAR